MVAKKKSTPQRKKRVSSSGKRSSTPLVKRILDPVLDLFGEGYAHPGNAPKKIKTSIISITVSGNTNWYRG